MTAEEYLKQDHPDLRELYLKYDDWEKIYNHMEKYAEQVKQQTVIEALEKEFSALRLVKPDRSHTAMIDADTYFNKEVKPKYEPNK